MSYNHIQNLYRAEGQDILLFRECYAMEKIHGTSASVAWRDGQLWLSGGCVKQAHFASIFAPTLAESFAKLEQPLVTVYGEAYGASVMRMSSRYGKALRFVAFEVKIGDLWLSVPQADALVQSLGLEFVHYVKIATDLAAIDAERDAPSVQAKRNGVEGDQPREGVVLRPLIELTKNNGERIVAKHKRAEERETATEREVVDPAKLQVLEEATAIATEWVTPMRLEHVLSKLDGEITIKRTGDVVRAMTEDVLREAAGEIVESDEARRAIGRRASELFRVRFSEETFREKFATA